MVDVDEYLKKAGGVFLRPSHVQVGDRLEILDEGIIDDKSFKDKQGNPRAYLILNVKHARTNEKYPFRLGPKNVQRIREAFGKNSAEWVGRSLEVVSIEDYAGLGQKGILVRGSAEAAKQVSQPSSAISQATVDAIRKSKDIMEMGIPLTEDDFKVISAGVRAELLKYGYVRKTDEGYFFTEKCKEVL